MTISSWLNFGRRVLPGSGLRRGKNFWLRLTRLTHSVCVSLSTFSFIIIICQYYCYCYDVITIIVVISCRRSSCSSDLHSISVRVAYVGRQRGCTSLPDHQQHRQNPQSFRCRLPSVNSLTLAASTSCTMRSTIWPDSTSRLAVAFCFTTYMLVVICPKKWIG